LAVLVCLNIVANKVKKNIRNGYEFSFLSLSYSIAKPGSSNLDYWL